MRVIVCLDEKCGMAFGGRRQSRDRVLCQRVIELVGEEKLWMNKKSIALFEGFDNALADENYLDKAGIGDYCFVETDSLAAKKDGIEGFVIYRWNRAYPSDLKFDIDLSGYKMVSATEFKGNSHDKITEEVYTL